MRHQKNIIVICNYNYVLRPSKHHRMSREWIRTICCESRVANQYSSLPAMRARSGGLDGYRFIVVTGKFPVDCLFHGR